MKDLRMIDRLRAEDLKKTVGVGFLARVIEKTARKMAHYLFNKGYLSDVVDIDALTGLYNRNFFERWMEPILAQAARAKVPLVAAAVDVDGLKMTNDTFGHAAGDRMLKNLARIFLRSVRQSDVVIRMGGDEFLLIFWNGEVEGLEAKMLKILAKAKEKKISFSFGLAAVEAGDKAARKINEADERMYEMKKRNKAGRG